MIPSGNIGNTILVIFPDMVFGLNFAFCSLNSLIYEPYLVRTREDRNHQYCHEEGQPQVLYG